MALSNVLLSPALGTAIGSQSSSQKTLADDLEKGNYILSGGAGWGVTRATLPRALPHTRLTSASTAQLPLIYRLPQFNNYRSRQKYTQQLPAPSARHGQPGELRRRPRQHQHCKAQLR